jgi:hypothetical protein
MVRAYTADLYHDNHALGAVRGTVPVSSISRYNPTQIAFNVFVTEPEFRLVAA